MGLRTLLGLKKAPTPRPPLEPIGGVRPRLWGRDYRRRFGTGDWTERYRPLLELAIDYRGKTVLDAGCNLGIVGYEISKLGPASYHGVDSYQPALEVARAIFSGVSVVHRFDRVDLRRHDRLARVLSPTYDIVLFLSVYQHIANRNGHECAQKTLSLLAGHCAGLFVATCIERDETEVVAVLKTAGLDMKSANSASVPRKAHYLLFARR